MQRGNGRASSAGQAGRGWDQFTKSERVNST